MFLEIDTLKEALNHAKLRDLPKKFNSELGLTWILAIVLIKKRNMMSSYAIAEQRADGVIEYKKTFGKLSPMSGLIAIYPYMYVDPDALEMAKQSSRKNLALHYPQSMDDILDCDAAHLSVWQLQYAMDMQKANMNQEKSRFGTNIVEEVESSLHPAEEQKLSKNEVVATVMDEGDCVIEVEDAKAFERKSFKKRATRTSH